MMSVKSWVFVLVVYVAYLVVGGFIFRELENPDDCKSKTDARDRAKEVWYRARNLTANLPEGGEILRELNQLFVEIDLALNATPGSPSLNLSSDERADDEGPDCFTWNYYNSVFFSFTAVTTIGYGHLSPKTDWGKGLCIIYSLIGVPLNAILVGGLASIFTEILERLTDKKGKKHAHRRPRGDLKRMLYLLRDVTMYMIPGVTVFLLLPSCVFIATEDWSYLDSFYFSFITLTTIGFGDFVAGRDESVLDDMGNWDIVYELGLIIWIIFGLGYIFMVITVIADNLKKPAKSAARRIRQAEKVMASKILQEIVDMKLKAGNLQEDEIEVPLSRTGSEPTLTTGAHSSSDQVDASDPKRRRARSLVTLITDGDVDSDQEELVVASNGVTRKANSISYTRQHQHYDNLAMAGRRNLVSILLDEVYQDQDSQTTDVEDDDDIDDKDEGVDDANDINHDTITSLRNFAATARLFARLQTQHEDSRFQRVDERSPSPRDDREPSSPDRFSSADQIGHPTGNSRIALEERKAASVQHSTSDLAAVAAAVAQGNQLAGQRHQQQGAEADRQLASEPQLSTLQQRRRQPNQLQLPQLDEQQTRKHSLASSMAAADAERGRQRTFRQQQHSPTSLSVPEILRQTTLEELLVAADKVRRKSRQEEGSKSASNQGKPETHQSREEASGGSWGLASRLRKISSPAAFGNLLGRQQSQQQQHQEDLGNGIVSPLGRSSPSPSTRDAAARRSRNGSGLT